jgi:DNA repair exonuclease SbcCD nuclease subunit
MRYLFFTDTHFTDKISIRVGDVLTDLIEKFNHCIQFANENDATIIHGGDFFDKAIVPPLVITSLIRELKQCKYVPIVIPGNHDKLYENETYFQKTSLRLLYETELIRDCPEKLEGNIFITSNLPIIDRGYNQIVLYHGYLNTPQDGVYTIKNGDFQAKEDKVLVCLGHLHDELPPLKYENYEIMRIGSLLRGIREEAQVRQPKCILINEDLTYKAFEVPAKSADLIFKEKRLKLRQRGVSESYTRLLELFKNSEKRKQATLEEVLAQVTDPTTIAYIKQLET